MSDYDSFDDLCVELSGLRGAVESGDPQKIAQAIADCRKIFNELLEEIQEHG